MALMNLDGVSLAKAECVCKVWREILSNEIFNLVWRRECLCNIDESVLEEITGIENISSVHVWKTIYKRWYIARKMGKWPVMEQEIQAHKGEICDIKILGDIIYTAGADGNIKLWDSWTGICLQTFESLDHGDSVRSIALYPSSDKEPCLPELVVSASDDHNISVWDVKTGLCKEILHGHNHIVSCVAIFKNLIVSASFDETIKVWDLKEISHSITCIKTLKGHYCPVTYLSVWNMKVLSVSENMIKLWCLESGKCLHTLSDVYLVFTSIQGCALRGNHALILTRNGELRFCDFLELGSSKIADKCSDCYRLLDYSTTQGYHLSCVCTYGNLMAVGSDAGVVYVYHYEKDWSEKLCKVHCKVQSGHRSLSCVRLSQDEDGPVLVTGSNDGIVKIYRWFSPSVD